MGQSFRGLQHEGKLSGPGDAVRRRPQTADRPATHTNTAAGLSCKLGLAGLSGQARCSLSLPSFTPTITFPEAEQEINHVLMSVFFFTFMITGAFVELPLGS